MPWLDEMVTLSLDGQGTRFHRMQALWFAIMDRIAPHIRITDHRVSPSQRARSAPVHPRIRRFAPTRTEAVAVRDALAAAIAQPWTLDELAGMVHLSRKNFSRVFVDAYGKTPRAYLTMLRFEEMARLLVENDLSIAQAGRQVGWCSRRPGHRGVRAGNWDDAESVSKKTGGRCAFYAGVHGAVPESSRTVAEAPITGCVRDRASARAGIDRRHRVLRRGSGIV